MPTILITAGNMNIARLVQVILAQERYAVDVIGPDRDILTTVKSTSPSLLIADARLPSPHYLDGFALLTALRTERTPHVAMLPVLLMIGNSVAEAEDSRRAYHLGANGCLVKPFGPMELLSQVRRILEEGEEGGGRVPLDLPRGPYSPRRLGRSENPLPE